MFSLLLLLDEKSKKEKKKKREKSHFTSWGYNTKGFFNDKMKNPDYMLGHKISLIVIPQQQQQHII